MVTLLTRFDARDEPAAAALAEALSRLSGTVPSEPGNLDYEVFATEESATTFYVKESWSSRGDADRHVRSVVESSGMERAEKLLAAPLATVTLREI